MKKDYLIVGQGLAGTLLAYVLIQQGKQVVVVDEAASSTSSKVAAGLYNPIVFKRIVKSWMVDEVLPCADALYASLEKELDATFHFKRQIVKLFSSDEERKFWLEKAAKPELEAYLTNQTEANFFTDKIENEFECAFVKQSGYLDIPMFLSRMKDYLIHRGAYVEACFDSADVKLEQDSVIWKNYSASKLIFCEGYKCTQNPYFKWLPFVLTKGEVLRIRIENFETDKVINKGVFFLHLGNSIYKVGATYEWKELSELPTEKGRSELVEKLKQVLKLPFEIVEHSAGIRPTVKDRRPLIGLHPNYPQLGIFNGLGTKAVLLAPYFALQFAAYLDGKGALNKEVQLERYASLLPKKN